MQPLLRPPPTPSPTPPPHLLLLVIFMVVLNFSPRQIFTSALDVAYAPEWVIINSINLDPMLYSLWITWALYNFKCFKFASLKL